MVLLSAAVAGGVGFILIRSATPITKLAVTTLVVSLFYNEFVTPDTDYDWFDLMVCTGIGVVAQKVL